MSYIDDSISPSTYRQFRIVYPKRLIAEIKRQFPNPKFVSAEQLVLYSRLESQVPYWNNVVTHIIREMYRQRREKRVIEEEIMQRLGEHYNNMQEQYAGSYRKLIS